MRELDEVWYVCTDDEATVKRCGSYSEAMAAVEEAKKYCAREVALVSERLWVREGADNE